MFLRKTMIWFCLISKINECNSIETIDKANLTNQTKFRLDEISKIENYFIEEINQRKSCSKKLSKYVAVFDYIDQALIVLDATSGGVLFRLQVFLEHQLEYQVQVLLYFFSSNRNSQRITDYNKKEKKKKHVKILTLAKSKLNSIETLV